MNNQRRNYNALDGELKVKRNLGSDSVGKSHQPWYGYCNEYDDDGNYAYYDNDNSP